MAGGTTQENGRGLTTIRPDGTTDCAECDLPQFPIDIAEGQVLLECANRHRIQVPLPEDRGRRSHVDSWVARKGAQLHWQSERRRVEREREEGTDR